MKRKLILRKVEEDKPAAGLVWAGPMANSRVIHNSRGKILNERSNSLEISIENPGLGINTSRYRSLSIVKRGQEKRSEKPTLRQREPHHKETLNSLRSRVSVNTLISHQRDANKEDMIMYISDLWGKDLFNRMYYKTGLHNLKKSIEKRHLEKEVLGKHKEDSSLIGKLTVEEIYGKNKEINISEIDIPAPEHFGVAFEGDWGSYAQNMIKYSGAITPTFEKKTRDHPLTQLQIGRPCITGDGQAVEDDTKGKRIISTLDSIKEATPSTAVAKPLSKRSSISPFLIKQRFASQSRLNQKTKRVNSPDHCRSNSNTMFKSSRSTSLASSQRHSNISFLQKAQGVVQNIIESKISNCNDGRGCLGALGGPEVSENRGSILMRSHGYSPDGGYYSIEAVQEAVRKTSKKTFKEKSPIITQMRYLLGPRIKLNKV